MSGRVGNVCFRSSSCGLSLKKQKFHTYLGQLLGICQIVNSNSQEDIQERIFWGAKEKIFTQQIQQTVPLLLPLPFFPHLQSPVYYGLTPCTTVLSSFLTHPLLLGASSAAQQVLDTCLSLAQHTSLVRIHTGAEQGGFTTLELQRVWDHRVVLETQQPVFSFQKTHTYTPAHTHTEDFTFNFSILFKRTTGRAPGNRSFESQHLHNIYIELYKGIWYHEKVKLRSLLHYILMGGNYHDLSH